MKVAIVLHGPIYPDVTGGAEVFTLQLALSLANRGYKVYLIAYRGSKLSSYRYGNLVFYSIKPSLSKIGKLLNLLMFFLYLVRIRPDVCLSIFFESSLPVSIYSNIFKRSYAIRFAGHDELNVRRLSKGLRNSKIYALTSLGEIYYRFLIKIVRRDAERGRALLIALHKTMRNNLIEAGFPRNSIIVIPNFILSRFFDVKPNYESRIIGYVGRLHYEKGVDILIRAFALIKGFDNNAKLLIVGDGPLRGYILELAKRLRIEDSVEVTGSVPNTKVPEYLAKMSIFVLPSRYEGLPNALLQAMAAGLPIVATSVGSVSDIIINGRNGLLVSPEDVNELAKAIKLLMDNRELAMKLALQARKDAKRYTVTKIIHCYEKVLKHLAIRSSKTLSNYLDIREGS